MKLDREGREFAHDAWRPAPPPDAGNPEIKLLGQWRPMAWWLGTGRVWDEVLRDLGVTQAEIDSGAAKVARILVAGPDADPGTAVVLPLNRTYYKTRLSDTPEIVVREGTGSIDVG